MACCAPPITGMVVTAATRMTKRTDDDSGNMIRNVSMIVQEPGEVEEDDSIPRKSRP